MRCMECGSTAVSERPERTAQGYRRFRCRACAKQFNERSGGSLNRTQYPSEGKRCGGDGAGFELTIGTDADGGYVARPVIVADVLAVQFHGSSVCSSFCFVRPETIRSSTSVR
jgi:hypothetical protein